MAERILSTEYAECMRKSYIDYSMSVITSRALPDIRDGLKPVQRRTLYAMYELGLKHDRPHRKCARIVGDTMGKYHPHGDSSIYDALVVMSQDFKKNEPLADPHGNFGSIEGDGSAAMRYTEARLKKLTEDVYLKDLDKDVVDFVPNFDETEKEPAVLPVRIPNFLINGSEGIAVGMTTNVPSHNLYEVIEGVKAVIDNPKITTGELMEIIKGPDFCTGGMVINAKDLEQIYATGSGKLKLRGTVELEKGKRRTDKDKLVIKEIPYTMIGEGIRKFLSDVATLVETRKLPEITDITNESSKEGIRIVLELKKDADVDRILNILYKKTKLEDTFGVNMLAIVDGKPETLSLKKVLEHNIRFQLEINNRKYRFLLDKELDKKEIQEGLIQAVDIIDLIIEIIRGSKTQNQAKACLMGEEADVVFKSKKSQAEAKKLHFTERQAQAILDLRLSKLIGLEILALEKEHGETVKKIARYEKLLGNEKEMLKEIKSELTKIAQEFGHPRKTIITNAQEAQEVAEELVEQDVVFFMDRFGYVKTSEVSVYEKAKEGMEGEYRYLFVCRNTDRILLFTDTGVMHQVKVLDIPLLRPRDKGVPVDNLSNYSSKTETILYAASARQVREEKLLFVTEKGMAKQVSGQEFMTANRTVMATKLSEDDRLIHVYAGEEPQIVIQTEEGYFLRFEKEEISEYKKASIGMRGILLSAEDRVKCVYEINPRQEYLLPYHSREIDLAKIKLGGRGQKGTKLRR